MRWFLVALVLAAVAQWSVGWSIIIGAGLLFVAAVMGEREIAHLKREKSLLRAKLQQRDHALQSLLDGSDGPARSLRFDQPLGPARSSGPDAD